ncbi:MAG TPA: NTP transferase domain-containing protein [Verrucomicrobiota bacterium]|nr:NTP transferase domain-containing protein [Verrucomicrobiota bacterium]
MLILLQGRLRSTRLPGKGFFTFFGETIWERMCDIALAVREVEEVVFATGDLPENHLMKPLIEAKGVRFFAGSETNVLERFCQAIEGHRGEYLIRLTCDNYLAQPDVIEGLFEATVQAQADYGYVEPLSHYAGEVVRCEALRQCLADGPSAMAREHVTWDIRSNATRARVSLPADYLGLDHADSLTLDTVEDLIRMKQLERRHPELGAVRCLSATRAAAAGLRFR